MASAIQAADSRLTDIADYYAARNDSTKKGSYRPLPPDALYLSRDEFERALAAWPVHRASIFAEPESATALDFGFTSARDFTPERGARGDNPYAVAAKHLDDPRQGGPQAADRRLQHRQPRAHDGAAGGASQEPAAARRRLAGRAGAGGQRPGSRAGPAARARLRQRRSRADHRAGPARRPAGSPQEEAQGRRRLPRRTVGAQPRRSTSSMPITASGATKACRRSSSARARTIASR